MLYRINHGTSEGLGVGDEAGCARALPFGVRMASVRVALYSAVLARCER